MADASHPKTGASHKRVGSVVRGKYRVEAFLATGTMGNVYSATHRNGSKVALKILHPQLAEDPSLCERFKREGYFANSIGHPGIVRAIDDDVTEDGCPFLVMELLEGETLDERRRRKGGKLALSWVLPVADSLLEILSAAHAREVVHRDLKPDNVFVTKTGEVKVLDFGVARWADGKDSSDMTAVGMVLGTPAYMPPEQALGRREDVDAQSDLWAVGATLFVVLSGESVHAGGDAKAKLIATARTPARPLREAAPDVPRSVAAVIDRALAFHKQERWPDAEAMREALRWARMSVEGHAPEALAATGETTEVERIPPPVPTKRAFDDEPTVTRTALPDELSPRSLAPQSKDFLTSAPPITLRDLPPRSVDAASSPFNEPVFSLRRTKDESPSTQRLPNNADSIDAVTEPGISSDALHARSMGTYDPSDAMGDDAPASSREATKQIEVNLSFTRPMAAMVLPADYEAPRPAAGAPPAFPPPAQASSPPHGSLPAQPYLSSAPPQQPIPAAMPTAPSLRALASQSSAAVGFSEAPGPMLSQIVQPRSRLARILVPIALAIVAMIAAFLAVRARAANAQRAAAAAQAHAPPPAEIAPAPAPVTATPSSLPSAPAPVAAVASADPPKRPKPKKKKPPVVVKPAEPPAAAEPTATATATSEPTPPSTPPAEPPPAKEAPPAKEPEPKPSTDSPTP